jgi:class 3 adenylate cyclase/pimeloyl-ACP methyl ester carboxylesterase
MPATTHYARSDEASIAYQVTGKGAIDLLFVLAWLSHVEHAWEAPALRRFLERLGAFTRLILFDRRGSGLSDSTEPYSLEQDVRDALAVLDAAGSERAAVLTYGLGGPVAARLAADHPERIDALIMYASVASSSWAPDYHWAMTREQRDELAERALARRGEPNSRVLAIHAPSMADDPALNAWFSRFERFAASPGRARVRWKAAADLDAREVLPRVRAPTLIMHRSRELVWDVRHSRYLAEHIPGARYVELDGVDSLFFVGDSDAIIDEIEEFLTGERTGRELTRALLTVMFTDIVAATARASELGDGCWRDLLAEHDQAVRKELLRFGGREVKTIGDGFLVVFDGPPSHALRCGRAVTAVAREVGIDIRVGMHTGECELIGADIGGMAVHIASRISALAGPGEVLVSDTVRGTVVGGAFRFEDRGLRQLKGVPGCWPLFALGP